ncbi:MAG: AAA family ATPase [Lachnospiraceae bacterium]|nr:AAA family ATPase [Lachnospiraceae bacterium]
MAVEKTPEEYMAIVEDICTRLTEAGIPADNSMIPRDLKSSFQYSMISLAIYIADADGEISETEREVVRRFFTTCPSVRDMRIMKMRDHIDENILMNVPVALQCAIRADFSHTLPNDIYCEQKAQIIADFIRMFGERILSVNKDASPESVGRLACYNKMIENTLRDRGVFIPVEKRLIRQLMPKKEEATMDPKLLEEALQELDGMIGLQGVKQEIHSLVSLMKVQQMREKMGIKTIDISKHMVFLGNPGTGKTTVARVVAKIYQYMGVLSKGTLVETDRAGLVKGYVGQTAARVKEVVEEAMGGVLFIDEAYSLVVNKSEGDFGTEAIDSLLKEMEDHREDFVVIVAGYPKQMQEFLASNPGLKSRFNKFITFDNYSPEEHILIMEKMLENQEYYLKENAKEYVKEFFAKRLQDPKAEHANARDVRNFLEQAVSNQACRVVELPNATVDDLRALTLADVKMCDIQ